MELNAAKTIALFALFFEALLCGLIPFVCVNAVRNYDPFSITRRIISCLSCFAGGVFFATSMLHMLPEVRELLEEGLEGMGVHSHFALAEFLTSIGFFIILVTEYIALMCHHQNTERAPSQTQHKNEKASEVMSKNEEVTPLLGADNSMDPGHVSDDHNMEVYIEENTDRETETTLVVSNHHDTQVAPGATSTLRSLLFLLALSLHSVFEGMAIGLQLDVAGTMELFIAIALHKGVVAFSFALNLIQSGLTKTGMVLSLFTFAIMSPIGVAVGIIVSNVTSTGPEAAFTNGFLQALATGTFLYVTFFEIIPHELNIKKDEMLKVLCIILGYGVMTLLGVAVPHEH